MAMMVFVATLCAVAVVTAYQLRKSIGRAWRRLWCPHNEVTLTTEGRALLSPELTEVTVQVTCACGWFVHGTLDATKAINEGLQVKA